MYDYTTPIPFHLMHEAEQGYDDNFVMFWHDQMDVLIAHGKPSTTMVFLAISRRANRNNNNTCFPTLDTIAKDAGVSRRTVSSAIQELAKLGLLTVTKRFTDAGDHTSHLYRVLRPTANPAGGSANRIPTVGTEIAPPVVQNLHPNYSNSNQMKIEQEDDRTQNTDEDFESWWSVYPRKVKKADARKAFQKINPDPVTLARMIADVQARIRSKDWTEQDGKFIPHPTTYLNQRRWEDEDGTMPAPTPLPDRDLTQAELREYKRWDDGWQAVYGADSEGFFQWQRDLAAGTLRQRNGRRG